MELIADGLGATPEGRAVKFVALVALTPAFSAVLQAMAAVHVSLGVLTMVTETGVVVKSMVVPTFRMPAGTAHALMIVAVLGMAPEAVAANANGFRPRLHAEGSGKDTWRFFKTQLWSRERFRERANLPLKRVSPCSHW